MLLKDFKWQTKKPINRTEDSGRQIVLDFGRYHLSIIDDGYGRDKGLLEIAVFSAADGVANGMTELPGITNEGDTVQGHLTEADVDSIIKKLYFLTGSVPTQI